MCEPLVTSICAIRLIVDIGRPAFASQDGSCPGDDPNMIYTVFFSSSDHLINRFGCWTLPEAVAVAAFVSSDRYPGRDAGRSHCIHALCIARLAAWRKVSEAFFTHKQWRHPSFFPKLGTPQNMVFYDETDHSQISLWDGRSSICAVWASHQRGMQGDSVARTAENGVVAS